MRDCLVDLMPSFQMDKYKIQQREDETQVARALANFQRLGNISIPKELLGKQRSFNLKQFCRTTVNQVPPAVLMPCCCGGSLRNRNRMQEYFGISVLRSTYECLSGYEVLRSLVKAVYEKLGDPRKRTNSGS